jgi:hypothetical protein
MEKTQPSSFVKWSLIVGIIIVVNLFFNYAISLVYKAPEYPNTQPQVVGTIYTKESCLSIGGQWTQIPVDIKNTDPQSKNGGYCDPDYSARIAYEHARPLYERNVFIILFTLGALILILGILIKQEVLAVALSWGGVLCLLIASMRYWSNANNLLKVGILAVALVTLMWLAVRKFSR